MTLQQFRDQTASLPAEAEILILCDGDLEPAALFARSETPAVLQEDMPAGSLLIGSEFDCSIPYTITR